MNIAPVTPRLLSSGLPARTSDIDNETSREALGLKKRRKGLDESFLIAVGVRAGDCRAGADPVGVVVRHVGDDSTDTTRRSCSFVYLGEQLSCRTNVSIPAEPPSVTAVHVHVDVVKIELAQSIGGQVPVERRGTLAFGNTHVGDQIAERVRLCSWSAADIMTISSQDKSYRLPD